MEPEMIKTGIGGSDFAAMIQGGDHYVDKTRFLRPLLAEEVPCVTVFTRPRRFGKTLAMSMLASFLEMNYADPSDVSAALALFAGLDVSKDRELCDKHLGRWPVISLSLKDVGALNFEDAFDQFKAALRKCAARYGFLLTSPRLSALEREELRILINAVGFAGDGTKAVAVRLLSVLKRCLAQHCGKKVIVIIDEYDVPLLRAFKQGYYEEMLDLVREFFCAALKDNAVFERAFLTGCVPLSKEGIFPGFDDFCIDTVSAAASSFGGLFGFTEDETAATLKRFGLSDLEEAVRRHYDGYRFGGDAVYNLWTIMSFCKASEQAGRLVFEDYWVQTGSNDLIHTFFAHAGEELWDSMKQLLAGSAAALPVEETIFLPENGSVLSPRLLGGLLLAAGYFTKVGENEAGVPLLKISNQEVQDCFRRQAESFFTSRCPWFRENGVEFARELVAGRAELAARSLRRYLSAYACLRGGESEDACYGHALGLLRAAADSEEKDAIAELESSRDAGAGYIGILFASYEDDTGVVLEFKKAASSDGDALDRVCDEALAQIKDRKYYLKLRRLGLRTVRIYGVAFSGEKCCFKEETLTGPALS